MERDEKGRFKKRTRAKVKIEFLSWGGRAALEVEAESVKEAVENVLDLYLPEVRDSLLGMVDMPAVATLLSQNGIRPDQRVTMPSAFMVENRLRAMGVPRKTKSVFEYVATGVPAGELTMV